MRGDLPRLWRSYKILSRSYLHYHPPIKDMKFLYSSVYQLPNQSPLFVDHFKGFSPDHVDRALNQCMKITQQVLLPLDGIGDKEGTSTLEA